MSKIKIKLYSHTFLNILKLIFSYQFFIALFFCSTKIDILFYLRLCGVWIKVLFNLKGHNHQNLYIVTEPYITMHFREIAANSR
jgi:hypothetical protein